MKIIRHKRPNLAMCAAVVWVADVLRYTGRVPGGFALHYNRRQCKRPREAASDLCWQHRAREEEGTS